MNYNYLHPTISSSHPEVFCEKGVFKNFVKFFRKTPMLGFRFHFGNFLFIFLRFLLLTLSRYLFAGNARKKQLPLFESFKYLTQQTNTCTKLVTVTLKQDVKFVKS